MRESLHEWERDKEFEGAKCCGNIEEEAGGSGDGVPAICLWGSAVSALAASAKQGHLISCCLQEAAVCYRYCSCRRYYPEPPRSSISSILIGLHHTATSRHTHTHTDRNRFRHECAHEQRVCGCRPWHALRPNICSKKNANLHLVSS